MIYLEGQLDEIYLENPDHPFSLPIAETKTKNTTKKNTEKTIGRAMHTPGGYSLVGSDLSNLQNGNKLSLQKDASHLDSASIPVISPTPQAERPTRKVKAIPEIADIVDCLFLTEQWFLELLNQSGIAVERLSKEEKQMLSKMNQSAGGALSGSIAWHFRHDHDSYIEWVKETIGLELERTSTRNYRAKRVFLDKLRKLHPEYSMWKYRKANGGF